MPTARASSQPGLSKAAALTCRVTQHNNTASASVMAGPGGRSDHTSRVGGDGRAGGWVGDGVKHRRGWAGGVGGC